MTAPGDKIVPFLFWLGFLALGFFTNFTWSSKTHPADEALVTETDSGSSSAPKTAQD